MTTYIIYKQDIHIHMNIDYHFKQICEKLYVYLEIETKRLRMNIIMTCPNLRLGFLASYPCLTSAPQEFFNLNLFIVNVQNGTSDCCIIYDKQNIWKFIFDGVIIKIIYNNYLIELIYDINDFCNKLMDTIARIKNAINFTNTEIFQINTKMS